MLYQLHKFHYTHPFILACSGGVDSMAIASFYHNGNKNFKLAYFHHNTPQADQMEAVVREWATANNRELLVGRLTKTKPPKTSPEEFWRNERYGWLASLGYDIITAQHLNDACEGYLFSAMNGNPTLLKSQIILSHYGTNAILYRPFLTNTKQDMIDWCIKHNVKWFEDQSNQDTHFPRNRIRHNILPEVLKVNPGFLKVIKKKYLNQ